MRARFGRIAPSILLLAIAVGIVPLLVTNTVAQYQEIDLVSDVAGNARNTDAHLVNAWGLAFFPTGPFWVSDAFSGFSTIYDHSGNLLQPVVTIPPAKQPLAPIGLPTGIVANPTSGFVVSKNGNSGPAFFLFATLDGTISGWNPTVDLNNAVIAVDNSTESPFPASYTGLALARNSKGQTIIYAADSGGTLATSNNRIDMYDGNFNLVGHFTDPNAPSDMTVYGIQLVKDELFVTFAGFTLLDGGVVDVFDTDGNFLRRFATNSPVGPLQAPWGVALAPEEFGPFSHALLVGNVDDGHINAFNRKTGAFLGQLKNKQGNLITIPGLWGMQFGAGHHLNGRKNQLFFTAGPNNYADGLFGMIVALEDD